MFDRTTASPPSPAHDSPSGLPASFDVPRFLTDLAVRAASAPEPTAHPRFVRYEGVWRVALLRHPGGF